MRNFGGFSTADMQSWPLKPSATFPTDKHSLDNLGKLSGVRIGGTARYSW